MRLVRQFGAVLVVAVLGSSATAAVQGIPWLALVLGTLTAVVAVGVYRWVVRRTEHRAVGELDRRGAAGAVARGSIVGLGMFAVAIAVIALLGGYHVAGPGSAGSAVALVGTMAAAAVTEELAFRGVVFRIMEERTGTWVAMTVTSLLFGIAHLLGPHASLWGGLAIAIEGGGLLAAAYVATRRLWLPIGLHFGWNLAGSAVFGTTVSGGDTAPGLLDASTSGSVLLAGGSFGPEASLVAVLTCAVAIGVLVRLARRRGHVVPSRRAGRATATLSR